MNTCADCQFWQTDTPDATWAAPCELGIIAKPEAWQFCASFTARAGAAQAEPPALSQQSQARGYALPLYRQYVPGGKP